MPLSVASSSKIISTLKRGQLTKYKDVRLIKPSRHRWSVIHQRSTNKSCNAAGESKPLSFKPLGSAAWTAMMTSSGGEVHNAFRSTHNQEYEHACSFLKMASTLGRACLKWIRCIMWTFQKTIITYNF